MLFNDIRKRSGFTLIEVVLSLAAVVIIFGIAAPVYQDYQVRNGVDVSVNNIIENLRRAQALSMAVEDDSSWGVNVSAGSIILFKGISFIARDPVFDETSEMLGIVSPSGLTEIIFSKLDGFPSSVGVLTLSASSNVRTISINEKGMLTY
ncbi:MAG: prepilin-type N-terminal cleavage/methylation domain-containing protein [Minisyncoccia bacterium]